MSSSKKRQLVPPGPGPESTNKMRQSPTSVAETLTPTLPDWNRMKTIENIPGAAPKENPLDLLCLLYILIHYQKLLNNKKKNFARYKLKKIKRN